MDRLKCLKYGRALFLYFNYHYLNVYMDNYFNAFIHCSM